jgi:hypothetical protein
MNNQKIETKTIELSAEELDFVTGGGLVSDAGAALVALSHAIVDGVKAGVGALANAGPGGGLLGGAVGPPPGGPHSGVAPANTLM